MLFVVMSILALVFAETLFFSIISGTSGTLGRYKTVHVQFWGQMQDLFMRLFVLNTGHISKGPWGEESKCSSRT